MGQQVLSVKLQLVNILGFAGHVSHILCFVLLCLQLFKNEKHSLLSGLKTSHGPDVACGSQLANSGIDDSLFHFNSLIISHFN